ncbi:unnamed protein product [Protopolystoma xenopodis]|uniref:Ion transport domain-containing protein n=1 Tax=Protopolystoma xenopodis TaxID=117903 RepID=A0A448XNK2_9PLAT|nr:unnamed protein product [Protopolystoma xenopodis]
MRSCRLLKIFIRIKPFLVVVNCILTILPSLLAYACMLFILFYFFATIGMTYFAGLFTPPTNLSYTNLSNETVNCNNSRLADSEYVSWHYCIFNFNSLTEAFVIMLVLTVGNNWHIFTAGHEAVTNRWTRLFFLIIHISCVLLVLNIVLAFIIEAFLIQFEAQKSSFEEEIRERLRELNIEANEQLSLRGLIGYNESGFMLTREMLDQAFPEEEEEEDGEETRKKRNSVSREFTAFLLHEETTSIEVMLIRMFQSELEELSTSYMKNISERTSSRPSVDSDSEQGSTSSMHDNFKFQNVLNY